ncbi:MAG: glycosyltransferase family 4 protein [bacterium]|nr:glycosyltransferase family 4 protein [bacterium]
MKASPVPGTVSASRSVLALTKYGALGASSRLRFLQYVPWLKQAGLTVTVQPLLEDAQLLARYRLGGYRPGPLLRAYAARGRALVGGRRHDLVWIEKEALPWWPPALETALLRGTPYALDFDDAVFHNYDRHPSAAVRRAFGRRLDRLMAAAALVVCGNSYLARRAIDAGAARVEIVPTVVDLERYPWPPAARDVAAAGEAMPRVVWIGGPSTAPYLRILQEPLRELSARRTFTLRVIGAGDVDLPGVRVESMPWTEGTEVDLIRSCDVGVMPLLDSPWEQGKCGYKLIQYMACGLPVVASPVGVNPEIVRPGSNGFLAGSSAEWLTTLDRLLSDVGLRARLGQEGRRLVEVEYCLQVTGPRLAELLRSAARPPV